MASPWTNRLATFARSALTGGAATLVDLGVIAAAVGLLHVTPARANAPALLAGAAVQFFGNRHFAFRRVGEAPPAGGALARQAGLFAASEAITMLLNFVLYHLVATHVALGAGTAVLARAVTTNAVFLLWSYPVWRRIFAPPPAGLLGAAEKG
jgi:putative flippase GtrA